MVIKMCYDEFEECENCGIVGEEVELREELGTLRIYLCDACYCDELEML